MSAPIDQSNLGEETLSPANTLGPGLDREKYIFAAFVAPKSRLEPLSCTSAPIDQSNLGEETLSPANTLGPGLDREKYIFAAFVAPKSRLEPLSCTSLNASRNIWVYASSRFGRKSMLSRTFCVDLAVQIFIYHLGPLFRGDVAE